MNIKSTLFFILLFLLLIGLYFVLNKIRPDKYIKFIVLIFGLITIMIPNFKDYAINYMS